MQPNVKVNPKTFVAVLQPGGYKKVEDVDALSGFSYTHKPTTVWAAKMPADFMVQTLEGVIYGHKDDYLICGIGGELYPCAGHIFERSYDTVKIEEPQKTFPLFLDPEPKLASVPAAKRRQRT